MREISTDALLLLIEYFSLADRYRWSQVARDYVIRDDEWCVIGRRCFNLADATRDRIRRLCQRVFDATLLVEKRPAHLWSTYLGEPLRLFTPWCSLRSSGATDHCLYFHVHDDEFVRTLRTWAYDYGLGVAYASRRHVKLCVWVQRRKRLMSIYRTSHGRVERRALHAYMARRAMGTKRGLARAMVEFRIWKDDIRPFVRHLEFREV